MSKNRKKPKNLFVLIDFVFTYLELYDIFVLLKSYLSKQDSFMYTQQSRIRKKTLNLIENQGKKRFNRLKNIDVRTLGVKQVHETRTHT